MLFDTNIEKLLSEGQSFSLEGFNIFYIGKDNLPTSFALLRTRDIAGPSWLAGDCKEGSRSAGDQWLCDR